MPIRYIMVLYHAHMLCYGVQFPYIKGQRAYDALGMGSPAATLLWLLAKHHSVLLQQLVI